VGDEDEEEDNAWLTGGGEAEAVRIVTVVRR